MLSCTTYHMCRHVGGGQSDVLSAACAAMTQQTHVQACCMLCHILTNTCAGMLQVLPHTDEYMCRHAAGGHSDEDAAAPSGLVRFPAVSRRPPGGRGGRSAQRLAAQGGLSPLIPAPY